MVHGKTDQYLLHNPGKLFSGSFKEQQFQIRNKINTRKASRKEYSGTERQSTCLEIESKGEKIEDFYK